MIAAEIPRWRLESVPRREVFFVISTDTHGLLVLSILLFYGGRWPTGGHAFGLANDDSN